MTHPKDLNGKHVHATNPLVTSDNAHGYRVDETWLNTVTQELFICVSDADGAAVWKTLTGHVGSAVLSGGTKVVDDARVTADSIIMLTCQVPGGTPGFLIVSARTAGVSFTILSDEGADTSTVGYTITEPAPAP